MKKAAFLAAAALVFSTVAAFCQSKKWAAAASFAFTDQTVGEDQGNSSGSTFSVAVGAERSAFDRQNRGVAAGLFLETRRIEAISRTGGLGAGCTERADFRLFYLRLPLGLRLPLPQKTHFLLEASPNWLFAYSGSAQRGCFELPSPSNPAGGQSTLKTGLADGFVGSELALGAGFRLPLEHGFFEAVASSTINGPVLRKYDWVAVRLGFGRFLGEKG